MRKSEKKANIETVIAKMKAGEVEMAAKKLSFNKISSDSRDFQRSFCSNFAMHKLFGF